MDQFWIALENFRAQLVRDERTKQLQILCRNPGSQPPSGSEEGPAPRSREEVLGLVEGAILDVLRDVSSGASPSLSYRRRDTWTNVRYQQGAGLEMTAEPSETVLRFDSLPTVKRFALTVKLLATIHRLVQTDTYCTKRDLYYQDTQVFGSQTCVDAIVDNISCMLRVPRACLHILATSKGLLCGDLRFTERDGTPVDCRGTSVMVPSHVEAVQNIQSSARFVLIVEKDAIYQRLVEERLYDKLSPCIIITGKGFPDVNTRLMVRRLSETLHIPILALVDADPHGIEILMVYRFGSRSMSFDASSLAVPSIRWLGVWPSDITRLSVPPSALIPFTATDTNKARDLLKRPYIDSVPEWKAEVERLLAAGMKAEIQCLDALSPHYLSDVYLPNKLCYGGWI